MDRELFMDYISTELEKRIASGRLVAENEIDSRLLEGMHPKPGERIFHQGFEYVGRIAGKSNLGFGWEERHYLRRPSDPDHHLVSLIWKLDKVFVPPTDIPATVAELEKMRFEESPIKGYILIGFSGGCSPLMRTTPQFDKISYSNWPEVVPQETEVEPAVQKILDFLCEEKHNSWTGM